MCWLPIQLVCNDLQVWRGSGNGKGFWSIIIELAACANAFQLSSMFNVHIAAAAVASYGSYRLHFIQREPLILPAACLFAYTDRFFFLSEFSMQQKNTESFFIGRILFAASRCFKLSLCALSVRLILLFSACGTSSQKADGFTLLSGRWPFFIHVDLSILHFYSHFRFA